MRKFSLILTGFLLVVLRSSLAAQDLTWPEVAPGVWKADAGKPEAYNLFVASGSETRRMGAGCTDIKVTWKFMSIE